MSNLFGSQPKIIPEFTGLQVNTSVQVLPIPIIYGCPRVSVNLIYYNGFNSQIVSSSSSGGKKGILGGGKGQGGQQVEYFATIMMAIGEGQLGSPLIIYQDQEVWTPDTYPTNGAYYYNGSSTQTPWPYVESNWPSDARGYKDTAYYGFSNAQLDASATVPQINFVIQGIFAGTSPLNYSVITINTGQYGPNGEALSYIGNITLGDADADPAQVIYDFLTNVTYGATFPANWIDTSTLFSGANAYNPNIGDRALSTYCQAIGLGWSVVIDNAESANSILTRWVKNLVVAVVWNGAQLRFIPYWDSYSGSNPGWDPNNGIPPKYYAPYTAPITSITLDHILMSENKGEDPITYARKDPLEVYNTIRLDFKDRTNFFNDVAVAAEDEAHIELYGPRVDNIGLADEYSLSSYANISAQMQLRRNVTIVRTYQWKMGPLWGWLEPMDILEIPDPANYNNSVLVRLTSVEADEAENTIINAEEYTPGSQSPTAIPVSLSTPPNQGATNVPPASVYPPVMFAAPTGLYEAQGFSSPQWIIGASAGYNDTLDENWGGANIWVSLDNVSYELLGVLKKPSLVGSLTNPLPGYGGSNPDNTDTLSVNLSECDGVLTSVSTQAASSGYSNAVLVDVSGFEIIAGTNVTLTGPNTYSITGLYRGLYGTTSRFFGAGSRFLFVGTGANIFETPLPSAYVGQLFYVKLQSFNVFNTATQELSECVAYQYLATGPTPVGPIAPPTVGATYRRQGGIITPKLMSTRKSTSRRIR
jgi:hypothetical protein